MALLFRWLGACWLLTGCATLAGAQNVAGFWLGVTYPNDRNLAIYNYTMTLTQNGATLNGTAQTADPDVPFGGSANITGQASAGNIQFTEFGPQQPNLCYWRGTLTYDPVEESLKGTYENITGTHCNTPGGGRVELYRIVLKSGTKYCKGSPIDLVVTGKNIRWYASESRTNPLATGNRYQPSIDRTTTFYITQTLYQLESPAVPITVEVVDLRLTATTTPASCSRADATLTALATGSVGVQYSLNGGAFQASPTFTGLSAGQYRVRARDAAGCQAEQAVDVVAATAPVISALRATPPRCGTANGTLNVVATGGTGALTYSLDGTTYQPGAQFSGLTGGAFTVRVRDAAGCEASRSTTLPSSPALNLQSVAAIGTTCGQANGRATLTVAGGTPPIAYSRDATTFQAANTFVNLAAGSYTLIARDSAGCTVSQPVTVAASRAPTQPAVAVTPETCGQQNGSVNVATGGLVQTATYQLDGRPFGQDGAYTGLGAGRYVVTMTDAQGCQASWPVEVPFDCANAVFLPTAFSPNADNLNDVLTAQFAFPSLTVRRLAVYNRWGTPIYGRTAFELRSGEPLWDGTSNGELAPPGTYLCQIEFVFPNGAKHTYRQTVSLLK